MAVPNIIGGRVRSAPHNENYAYFEEKTNNLQSQITANEIDAENKITTINNRLQAIEAKNTQQDSTLASLQNQITANENDIENKYAAHKNGTADKHTGTHIVNDSNVAGTSVKDALNRLKNDNATINARIDNIIAQSGTSSTEVVDSRHSATYGQYATLDARLEAIEARSKYFAREVKTLATGGTVITLTNTPESLHKLLIYDTTYGCIWEEGIHWNRTGNQITFTSAMPEDFTFVIYNLG